MIGATAPTIARAHLLCVCGEPSMPGVHRTDGPCYVADLESRAIAMLDDDQLWATFFRWRTALHGESAAPSLCEKLSVQAYVDAIFQKVPQ